MEFCLDFQDTLTLDLEGRVWSDGRWKSIVVPCRERWRFAHFNRRRSWLARYPVFIRVLLCYLHSSTLRNSLLGFIDIEHVIKELRHVIHCFLIDGRLAEETAGLTGLRIAEQATTY